MLIQETEICNFAEDNLLHTMLKSLDELYQYLTKGLKLVYKINSMAANPIYVRNLF